MIHLYRCIAMYRCIVIHQKYVSVLMYRYPYCSVCTRACKSIHLYRDTSARYIRIQHTYTLMKPNETAIHVHQMYLTYSYTHVGTEPYIGIQRYSTIQRYSDTTRYSDTDVSPPLRGNTCAAQTRPGKTHAMCGGNLGKRERPSVCCAPESPRPTEL